MSWFSKIFYYQWYNIYKGSTVITSKIIDQNIHFYGIVDNETNQVCFKITIDFQFKKMVHFPFLKW
jgi:hypothetical protein